MLGMLYLQVTKYEGNRKLEWDNFVKSSKNGHFFFYRDYMEYHSDRFQDFSLIIYNDKGNIMALLPASIDGDTVISHGGLTFGGFVCDSKMTAAKMLDVFANVKQFLKNAGVRMFIYKCMPAIYNKYPSDEDLYALFRNNAELYRRDVSFSIYLPDRLRYQEQRKRAVKKGYRHQYILHESSKYEEYIALLDKILMKYHGTHPVHNVNELRLLAEKFSNNIKLYTAEKNGRIEAGTVLFLQTGVVHTQYLANSDEGKKTGALDCLLDWLITDVYKDKTWFDFGISCEQEGRYLNEGLAAQKEGFGARAVVHDFYRIEL